ncbi:MAG: hypothetical protein ABFD69_06105 [Candidatus Sumerlaeia bacterium]
MTRDSRNRFIWVCLFGLSMGYFEAAAVLYLRGLYAHGFPEYPHTPYSVCTQLHRAVELGREAMSILMLLSVAMLAGRRPLERFAFFICAFGVWDVFYYAFLYLAVGWPSSLATRDVLFLLPAPWVGPVWSAASLAVLFVVATFIYLWLHDSGRPLDPTLAEWAVAIAGALVIVYSWLSGGKGAVPYAYPWWIWLIGTAMGVAAFGSTIQRSFNTEKMRPRA